MLRDAVINVGSAGRGGGAGGALGLLLVVGACAGLLLALTAALGSIQHTVMLSDPSVRAAEGRAQIADAERRAAEAERQRAQLQEEQAADARWHPLVVGGGQALLLGAELTGGVVLVLLLVGSVQLFRRHLSLPTRDGRVPLVGLDRELSAEALFRYQALQGKGPTYEALPVGRRREDIAELLDPERAPAPDPGGGR